MYFSNKDLNFKVDLLVPVQVNLFLTNCFNLKAQYFILNLDPQGPKREINLHNCKKKKKLL